MKNLSKIIRVGLIASLFVFVLAGCKPKVDLEALVKEAYGNQFDIKQQTSKISVSGMVSVAEDKGEADDVSDDVEPAEVEFDLNLDGYYARAENFDPTVDTMLNGEFKVEQPDQSLAGKIGLDLKLIDKVLYLNLKQIPEAVLGEAAVFVKGFVGKWWKFTLPEEVFAQVLATQSEEQLEKMRELFKTATIFSNLKNLGLESVNGVEAYKIRANLDKAGIIAYVKLLAETNEAELTEQDLTDLGKVLDLLQDKPVELWISEKEHNFIAIAWDFDSTFAELQKIIEPETEGETAMEALPEGEIALKIRVDQSDLNKVKEPEVPADAVEFDLNQFFPTGGNVNAVPNF